jgi:hypothetical protein
VIATAKQRPERMLMGIELAEAVDVQQGGKKQRLPATQKRRLTVRQQRKVIARMRLFLGLYRLRELSHNRGKGMLLVEPMGTHMHTDAGQTGRNRDQLALRLRFFFARLLGVAALSLD